MSIEQSSPSKERPVEKIPIFTYGSLTEETMVSFLGGRAIRSVSSAYTFGVKEGIGDHFPCADKTFQFSDRTDGMVYELEEREYEGSLAVLDEYEGVDEGYYKREVVFVHSGEQCSNLLTPAWIYTRGELLHKDQPHNSA